MHHVQLPPIRPGRHEAPATLDDALAALAAPGRRARVVAGGTDLMIELDRRVGGEVDVLVDITRIPGLDSVSLDDGRVRLGALVTHNRAATDPVVLAHAPLLAQACIEVGSPALRNRATIVGNLVTASPANDTISALAALDAEVIIASVRGIRRVPLAAFHLGVRRTVLEADELVTEVTFPALPSTARSVFVKLGLRRAQAISVVHVALVCDLADDATVRDARIALGSVAPTIVRAAAAEAALVGSALTPDTIAAGAALAAEAATPIDDLRSGAAYRSDGVEIMVRRGLEAIAAGPDAVVVPTDPPTLGGPTVPADGHAMSLGPGDLVRCTVNGTDVAAAWTPGTLLDWLRDEADLTGTKEGCAEGECGACTVHLDGVATLSCLIPAGRAHGSTLTTIEGLAPGDGALHPLQRAFVDCAAVQCGYCIPGFLMAGAALCAEREDLDDDALTLGLSGNLCRCTGYTAIRAAVHTAAGSTPVSVSGSGTDGEGSAR